MAPVTVALKLIAPPAGAVVREAVAVTVSRPPSNTSIEIGAGWPFWLDCTSSRKSSSVCPCELPRHGRSYWFSEPAASRTGYSEELLKSLGDARSAGVSWESAPSSGDPSSPITVIPLTELGGIGVCRQPRIVGSDQVLFAGSVTSTNPCRPSSFMLPPG